MPELTELNWIAIAGSISSCLVTSISLAILLSDRAIYLSMIGRINGGWPA